MKLNSLKLPIWLCILMAGAVLGPATPALNAADNVEPATTKPAGYDLEISNGLLIQNDKRSEATLANVADVLRARYQHANIVLSPGLAQLQISDLKLRAGQLLDELEAIRAASGERFNIQGPRGPVQFDPTTGLPVTNAMNSGLFILQANPPEDQERFVEAFNIEPYLTWLVRRPMPNENPQDREKRERESIDDLTRMVTETIEMVKSDGQPWTQPVFRYHRGANLLVVVGSRQAVEVARKVVNALPGMGTPPRAEAGAPNAAAMEAFRKRYGLERVPQDSGGAPPPAPAQK